MPRPRARRPCCRGDHLAAGRSRSDPSESSRRGWRTRSRRTGSAWRPAAPLTYSGDTAACDAFDDLAGGTDLLLAEASYVEGRTTRRDLHLTGREAGEAAAAAGVGRLVVTHVPPWQSWERAVADAAGPTTVRVLQASPGLVLEV